MIDVLRAHPPRSALQEGGGDALSDADFGRRLSGQREVQALQQQLKFWLGLCVASKQKLSSIGGRDTHIDHLHSGKFLQCTAGGESGCEGFKLPSERDLQAVREDGDEHVRLDAFGILVEDRADRQIALQGSERLFDLPQLQVVVPQLHRI